MRLEYELIESEQLAADVKGTYTVGRSLGYDYSTSLKISPWSKNGTREVIDINTPRKSMKAVVLLFTKKDAGDSEEFVFPNLTGVNVTVEGNPNDIYSEGLAKRDMYREAVRFFTNTECEKYLGRRKYYTDKFACVIDFQTVDSSGASAISEGDIFIYSCSAQLISFEDFDFRFRFQISIRFQKKLIVQNTNI